MRLHRIHRGPLKPVVALACVLVLLAGGAALAADDAGKVNINTASIDELQSLPGVGPSIAQRIIDYREANGPFARTAELMNVRGIGEKTYERLKDQITVGTGKRSS